MLTINYDSWFVRKYLGYGSYSPLPKTVCELGRVILGMTILYLLAAICIAFLSSMYLTAVFGLFYVLFTDATINSFFDLSVKEATWYGLAWGIFWMVNVIATIAGVIIGYKWLKEYRRTKREMAAQKLYEETGSWDAPAPHPAPITEFFKGVWARIHDKTCALIQWENDPAVIRERERKREHDEYMARIREEIKNSQKA